MSKSTIKSLDVKLKRIVTDPSCKDFILADAKDADMAYGLASAGRSPKHHAQERRFRTLQEYRDLMRQNVNQGLLDIMLMSASTSEQLTIVERLFDDTAVTPAVRANDTSDIHLITGSVYANRPSQPFRTATIDHIMCGKVDCNPDERRLGANLGLYSVTFNNNLKRDLETLSAYGTFRIEAERKGFRHFLEVFNPNACDDHCPPTPQLGRFINDHILRMLAGVTRAGRPLFLKIPYHGPQAMEQLASYDRSLVPGILGGTSGTTMDAFHQLWEAKKYGARAALYGRMINNSEHQVTFIQHLRKLADDQIDDPAEAVRSYHGALTMQGIAPFRQLQDDLMLTRPSAAYGTGPTSVLINGGKAPHAGTSAQVDFAQMTPAEKVVWNRSRWDRILGG